MIKCLRGSNPPCTFNQFKLSNYCLLRVTNVACAVLEHFGRKLSQNLAYIYKTIGRYCRSRKYRKRGKILRKSRCVSQPTASTKYVLSHCTANKRTDIKLGKHKCYFYGYRETAPKVEDWHCLVEIRSVLIPTKGSQ